MDSEWVRDKKRRLLYLKRTVNGRTRVYGKSPSDGHYGYEGYVDPNDKFIRRPDGERIGRGNHPDLIHAEAELRRNSGVAKEFTNSQRIRNRANGPAPRRYNGSNDATVGAAYMLVGLVTLSTVGLEGISALITALCVIAAVIGFFISSPTTMFLSIATIVIIRLFDWMAKAEEEEKASKF